MLVLLLLDLARLPRQKRLERHSGGALSETGALLLDQHLERHFLVVFALLGQLALEREAGRERVSVDARLAVRTAPEPTVRFVLDRFDEIFAHLCEI